MVKFYSLKAFILMIIFLCGYALYSRDSINIASGEWPPYLGEDLPEEGFVGDIIREAFDSVGMDVHYGYFPWQRSYIYAVNGGADNKVWHATAVWLYTEERALELNYSEPVIEDIQVLFSLKSNLVEWDRFEDLRGLKIGVTLHTVYPVFDKLEEDGIITMERHGGYDTLFLRLLHRKLDAILYDKKVAEYFLRNSLDKDKREQIGFSNKVVDVRRYHLVFSKKLKENRRYIELFNLGLEKIRANGTYSRLESRFNDGYYDRPK